jgi:hypothetical protein
MVELLELEDGSGDLELENATGSILLEASQGSDSWIIIARRRARR